MESATRCAMNNWHKKNPLRNSGTWHNAISLRKVTAQITQNWVHSMQKWMVGLLHWPRARLSLSQHRLPAPAVKSRSGANADSDQPMPTRRAVSHKCLTPRGLIRVPPQTWAERSPTVLCPLGTRDSKERCAPTPRLPFCDPNELSDDLGSQTISISF